MKFRLWEIIILASLFVVAVTFSFLNSVWSGFVYFNAAVVAAFIGLFINNRIYYIKHLKNEYDEGLDMYFAELYNNGLISREQFTSKDEKIVEGYYKDYKRTRLINILMIIVLAIVIISVMLVIFNLW